MRFAQRTNFRRIFKFYAAIIFYVHLQSSFAYSLEPAPISGSSGLLKKPISTARQIKSTRQAYSTILVPKENVTGFDSID
jgi:hypothetical protein